MLKQFATFAISRRAVAALLAAAFCAGCGIKGPLQPAPRTSAPAASPAADADAPPSERKQ
jgi:hypothetical protein